MHLCEFIERKWRNFTVKSDSLHVDLASEEFNVDVTKTAPGESQPVRFYCHDCGSEFPVPKGMDIHWEEP